MLKVHCEACGASYEVDPRRVPPNGMKMRCPACGASVHVAKEPEKERAQPGPAIDALDLDLPAPKAPGLAPASAFTMPSVPPVKPAASAAKTPFGGVDLPAVKPAPTSRLSASIGDDLADLPAPKPLEPPAAPPAATKSAGEPIPSTFELDLPAPKAGTGKASAQLADLPAPKSKPGGKPSMPSPADLPAPKSKSATTGPAVSDLPAPKAQPAAGPLPSDLPPAKSKPSAPGPLLSDLSDLPAPKSKSATTGPMVSDLPAPKAKPAAGPSLSDLPALKAKPAAGPPTSDLSASKAKPAAAPPASDQPAAKPKPPGGPLLSDLPAPKSGAGPSPADLPAPKVAPAASPSAAGSGGARKEMARPKSEELDLPALRGHADLPAVSGRAGASLPSLDLDAPLGSAPAANLPKRSFARPSLAETDKPASPRSSPGTMPKDSLAIEPKPFFGSTPPAGILGKLDELDTAPEPKRSSGAPDLIDLPAPGDLPQVKRASPKTALGLGRSLPRDSLDLPSGFGGPAAEPLPMTEPEMPFGAPQRVAPPPEPTLSDLDLPAPRDLPVVKKKPAPLATALGLGSGFGAPPKGGFEVQVLNSAAASAHSPELSLDLPPMSGQAAGRTSPELDLSELEGALDHLESKGGGSFGALDVELDLSPRKRDLGSFGELEPIELPTAPSNTNAGPYTTMELAPNDLMLTGVDITGHAGPAAHRGELGIELKGMLDLSSEARDISGTEEFGELDLGVGHDAPVPRAVSMPRTSLADARVTGVQDAELVGLSEEERALREKRRRRFQKRMPGWLVPLGIVASVALGGVALGLFTRHGYFGVYLLEQLLPAAGDPERVREAIQQAERKSRTDTYGDVRKALTMLSDARNEAGLNIDLLVRSLLHEALYQVRFGEDAQSAQRAAAILARLVERGGDSPELKVAKAADLARRGELTAASRLLAEAPAGNDPYRDLLAGELALLDHDPGAAERAFTAAKQHGAGARGSWGLARALIEADKHDAARAAAEATLAESPRHADAHAFLGDDALKRGDIDAALQHARVAAGRAPVDGERARPSRDERANAYALEGHIEEAQDHPAEAQAAYEHALVADPLRVDVLLGSGRMLMRLGRPQDALSRFDSALSARPSATLDARGSSPLLEAGLGAIQALLALGRAQEALERSQALRAQFPDVAQAVLWHGQVLTALERWNEAEAAFRQTIEKAPKLFAGYVALSQLLFKRDRPEEAARLLSLASGKVDDGAEVRRMLGHSELARNHLPEAIKQFHAALRFDARDGGALYGLAVAQRKSGALDNAEQTLARLMKVDPTFPGLALEQGQLQENRGEYEQAIATYRKALEQRPTDDDLKLRLGAALVTAGQVDEAETVLDQVLKARPSSAEAEHYLGRVLFARKETAQAVQRFERAVNFDTRKAEYHMFLGWALLEQGNYGAALSSIEKAIARDPNLGDARWLLGRIQLRTGAVRDALGNFQAALRLSPGRVDALANMGDAYDELRDLPQAIKSYEEALQRAPDNAAWWYRLARLELDRGKKAEARAALSEAVLRGDKLRDRPMWLADAHRTYADILREAKRPAEANEHYRLFLEIAPPNHPDRREIEALLYRNRR